jgi:protein-L-isoaspartate(D-aspartate) O-methyltransferase
MAALEKVPRHESASRTGKMPTPIGHGHGKTISQLIVALMTDLLDLGGTDTVLEIGTGLGYQAAILAELAQRVQRRVIGVAGHSTAADERP